MSYGFIATDTGDSPFAHASPPSGSVPDDLALRATCESLLLPKAIVRLKQRLIRSFRTSHLVICRPWHSFEAVGDLELGFGLRADADLRIHHERNLRIGSPYLSGGQGPMGHLTVGAASVRTDNRRRELSVGKVAQPWLPSTDRTV